MWGVMRTLGRLIVGIAVGATALLTSNNVRAASVIDITGGTFGAFPGYSGSNMSKNNVINYDPAGIEDNKGGSAWHIGGAVLSKDPILCG